MKNFFSIIILLFSVLQGILFSQTPPNIDSLKQALSNSKNIEDSVSTLCWLCWRISDSNPDQTYYYGKKVLELSTRINNEIQVAEIYDAAALGFRVKGDLIKAKELYHKALDIGIKHKLINRIAWENHHLASIFEQEGITQEIITHAIESRKAFAAMNNIRMIISNDWFLVRTNQKSFIDTTINDTRIALKMTKDPNQILTHHLDLIYLYGKKENRTQSMLYAMRALEIAEEIKDQKAIIKTCYQIAEYLRDYQHNYEVALEYYQKILNICEKENSKEGLTGVFEEIGIVHKLLGNDSLAAVYFNRCLSLAKEINHRHFIAKAYNNIGTIYYSHKNYNEALKYFIKCYETGCNECKRIVFHQVLVDIGNAYLKNKDYKNALVYINKSLQLADSANSSPEQAVSYLSLANYYLLVNNSTDIALRYLHTALEKAKLANSLSLQKESAIKLNEIYKQRNDFQNAYNYLAMSQVLTDSLKKISDAENLSRLETKFEFQNLKAQKEAEIIKQTQQKYFFIAAFILTSILGLVIYKSLHRKKRDSRLLEFQKKQLEEMSEQVHEADQKKLNFFTNISHEFRTPLTLILGPIEKLIKDTPENRSSLPMLNMVRRNTLHLYNLINQLLDIRKLDTGNIKLKVTKDDIACYSKGIYSTFIHLAQENNVNYYFDSEVDSLQGWFDKDIVEKVLNNLLSNAFKYTEKSGEILINLSPVSKEGSHIKLVIRDNGKGIPEDQIQYVFDRYYQVENTNTGFNTGTGIGLAYTKELIELHKGEISVESRPGSGTSFTIILPIDESFYSADEKSTIEVHKNNNDTDDIRQKYLEEIIAAESGEGQNNEIKEDDEESKIMLVIEDNSDLREFIKNIFLNDFTIYEASEGDSGYKMACELVPDVIISDIMMPGMNGLELSNKLKSNIHTNHIPILILTAKTGFENEMEGLKTGADDYLTKPFNSEILSLRVKRLIESKKNLREYFTREFILNPKEVKLPSPEDEFLKKAIKIIEDNITDPELNIEMLANNLSVSKMQLFRKLKALTNFSGNQFIRNIKLKRAAQLLQQQSLNITEVLYESGFNSPSYFTTCFKEMYGCLPKEYALKHKKETFPINS